jgi:hypothetical protein
MMQFRKGRSCNWCSEWYGEIYDRNFDGRNERKRERYGETRPVLTILTTPDMNRKIYIRVCRTLKEESINGFLKSIFNI